MSSSVFKAVMACCLSVGFVGSPMSARADNWPQWRGPKNNGISTDTGLPTKWSKTDNVAWRLSLPGQAGATPVVWGERIFLTSVNKDELLLMCVGADGKEQWRQVLSSGNKDVRGDEGNSASPSPSTDGQHVWAMKANCESCRLPKNCEIRI